MQNVLQVVRTAPADTLPRVLGMLREIESVAISRLSQPAPAQAADEWLTVAEACSKLHCSRIYLYKNAASLPFARHLGKKLLFSNRGIDRYLLYGK